MAQPYNGGYVTVAVVGKQLASGAASASSTIPVMSSGEVPRFIRVAATAAACIKLGGSGVVATGNDCQVQPGDSLIMTTNGNTYFAVIQVSAGGLVNVAALENM